VNGSTTGPWRDFLPRPPGPRDRAPADDRDDWKRHQKGDGHPGQRAKAKRRARRRNRR